MSPDDRAKAAEDHEAEAVMQAEREHAKADQWEARALLDETEIGHLRTLAAMLERTALPVLDPDRRHEELPASDVTLPDWALPLAVVAALAGIDDGIAAAREWAAGELDALGDVLAGRLGWDGKRGEWKQVEA